MEEIVIFLDSIFDLEKTAIELGQVKSSFDDYNKMALELKSHLVDNSIAFGPAVLRRPKPDRIYQRDWPPVNRRILLKISEYENQDLGLIWACYSTNENPQSVPSVIRLSNCILISHINGSLKVVGLFFKDFMTEDWRFGGGKLESFNELGTLLGIQRLTSPIGDVWSIEEYNADR